MSTIARFTLKEYERMLECGVFESSRRRRIELIHGELREMPPAGPTHSELVARLNRWVIENLGKDLANIWSQNTIILQDLQSAPEPDLVVLKPKSFINQLPTEEDVLLIIEVAESSLADDRGEKAILYAEAGIADYWIVNIRDWCVEVHRNPESETYQSVTSHNVHDSISPLAFPEVSLDIGKLFET